MSTFCRTTSPGTRRTPSGSRIRRAFAALLCASSLATAGELQLNQLDACDSLASTLQWVRDEVPSSSACRSGSGPIERLLVRALGPTAGDVCFVRQPPGVALSGFRCLRFDHQGSASLTCYRPSEADSIEHYKRHYNARFAAAESQYLARARRCPASNGDTSNAGPTHLPSLLAVTGEHEIAFISQLGRSNPSDAAVVHGFARSSPELAKDGITAFEYVSLYRSSVSVAVRPGTLHGRWRLQIDDATEAVAEMERMFRRAGASVQIRMVDVSIRRDPQATAYAGKGSVVERIAKVVMQGLSDEGFKEFDKTDLEEKAGIQGGDVGAAIRSRIPFGHRSLAASMGSNLTAAILMKTQGAPCMRGDAGAIGAGVMRFDGPVGVQADAGGISVMVFGVGACSRRIDPTRRYIAGLVDDAREAIVASLPDN